MKRDERTSFIEPAGVMAMACTHRRPDATREAPAVIAVRINLIAARIHRMATKLIGILSRVAFFVCGVISVLLSNLYRALQGLGFLPNSEARLFSIALMVVGGLAVIIALLPSSWVEKACKAEPAKPSLLQLHRDTKKVWPMLAPATMHQCCLPGSYHPPERTSPTTCAGFAEHARVRQSTAAKKEGGSLVRGTEESDRIAALASTQNQVRA